MGENVEEVMQKQHKKEICGERKEKIEAQLCQKEKDRTRTYLRKRRMRKRKENETERESRDLSKKRMK